MSQEHVELAGRTGDNFNAFMRGELTTEAYAEPFDPEIELHWHDQRTYPDTPQRLRGIPEVIEFTQQYRRAWDDLAQERLELIEAPDNRVVVLIRQSGRGRESGVPIVIHFFELVRVHVVGHDPGHEPDRKQDDDRRQRQAVGHDPRRDREHDHQSEAREDGVRR